jgi:hypothetical protein
MDWETEIQPLLVVLAIALSIAIAVPFALRWLGLI